MMDRYDHWQVKLAAWTHDPAEKALILMRTPEGHEGGTVRVLRQRLFPRGIPEALEKIIQRADHWASAADRPQFPREEGNRYARWAQVRFDQKPELIHPLSAERYELDSLKGEHAEYFKIVSIDHFRDLIDDAGDPCRTALAFWRFGPETPAPGLNHLWQLLPADTRVPDHTIWSHLDLTAAFATAMQLDEQNTPALLTVSFGPVQEFIAQARSTSDLWAGSHLLSRIAWEGLKVICERLGPDAVIFPQLRGVALVDLWLQQDKALAADWFSQMEWRRAGTDANPLFAAALPNRFVAIVPADQARSLAETIAARVGEWVRNIAEGMLGQLLQEARCQDDEKQLPCWQQLATQLVGFPEVHWATVPWSLIGADETGLLTGELRAAQQPFFPPNGGFLASAAWKLLSGELRLEGQTFYKPNPGVLYPAVYELLDRVVAAAKAVRPFEQTRQSGYRDSLSGEAEWLTTDRRQLELPPGQRGEDTLWKRLSSRSRFGIRPGEHLNAFGMLKRLWPSCFQSELRAAGIDVDRYVVSTHTLALATSLERWIDGKTGKQDLMDPAVNKLASRVQNLDKAVLPKNLADRLRKSGASDHVRSIAERLPSLLDIIRQTDDPDDRAGRELQGLIAQVIGARPEAYYGLILMDGDRMGAWLSGSGPDGERYRLPYADTWHSAIRNQLARQSSPDLQHYQAEKRSASPARHMAISGALNGFSLQLARYVIEDLCKGKLLYAGGDDVMAMVSVDDLLSVMLLLRLVYSGIQPSTEKNELNGTARNLWDWLGINPRGLKIGGGHAVHKDRIYRLMGAKATASIGAVVAHHTAPLGRVLEKLRTAEQRAKSEGGRDAFSLALLKRSGGAVHLTAPWWLADRPLTKTPIGRLIELRNHLGAGDGLKRRAAYLIQTWLPQLPSVAEIGSMAEYRSMLAANLRYQFARQGGETELGDKLADLAIDLAQWHKESEQPIKVDEWLQACMSVAEFLAREGRFAGSQEVRG